MVLQPGDHVAHFVIVSQLGAGGMGQVYLARDTRLQRSIALKIVQPDDDEGAVASGRPSGGAARLLREAQAAAALEHPNVVTIYEVGEIPGADGGPGTPFIAMELVKGKPLRAYVGDRAVPMHELLRWLTDIARALGAAHEAGLIHRDMKPENVMIREDGVVRVLDFGLAKRAASASSASSSTEAQVFPSLTGKGVAVGTPYYMAPEQMRREALDGRADQFSWGVVAYELLSGVPPWGADVDALELVSKLLTENPAPLGEVAPETPPSVAAVVMRALAKRRVDRFATMKALIDALEARGDAPAVEPPMSVAEQRAAPTMPPSEEQRWRSAQVMTEGTARAPRSSWALYAAGGAAILVAGALGVRSLSGHARVTPTATSATPAAPSRECAASAECVAKNGGEPFVCSTSGRCTAVETDQCKALFEPRDLQRDDTVWVGAMFPQSGPAASFGVSNMNAVELARRDFAQASASLRTSDGSAPVHPLAVVACDDAKGSEAAARHLVLDLGVPAVIGFSPGPSTVDLATSLFVPHDTLTIASITLTPLLASVPHAPGQPRMVWRTTYDDAETARAIAAIVARLEARVRASGSVGPGSAMRVAVVRKKNPSMTAFAEALFQALRFNGKPALENGQDYREFSFADPASAEDHAAVAAEVARFQPTVVIFAASSDIVARIEDAWPAKARSRPYYVSESTFDSELLGFVGKSKDRRRRLLGFTSVSTTMPNARFVLHYNETFPEPITRTWAPNSSYDAFYLVGYAAYALGREAVTGRALADAIGRLVPPGPSIDVGPSGILGAFSVLSRGDRIDLNGATGSLDFDLRTGEAPVDLAALCTNVDANGVAVDAIESGQVFNAKSGELVGEPRCP